METKIDTHTSLTSGDKIYLCETVKSFPFKSTLSFEYLIEFWKKEAESSNKLRSDHAKNLLEQFFRYPKLSGSISDLSILDNHTDLIEQLMSAIYPPSRWETQISTSNAPFQFQPFYSSPLFYKIFGVDAKGNFGNAEFSEHDMLASKILSAYLMILKKFYGKKLKVDHQFIMAVRNESLKRYFKIDVDPQFVNIKAVGEPPQLGEEELNYILEDVSNLDRWREVIPTESFEFVGFVTITATNVTDQETMSQLKYDLLERASIISTDRFLELQQKLRSYLRMPDIKLGLAAFSGEWKMMLDYGNKIGLSFIMNERIKSSCENIKDSIYAAAFSDKEPIIIDDLTKLENRTVVEEEIIRQGIFNIIIAPLYYKEELVGILELGSPNKSELNSLVVKKLKEILSLFSIAVSRNIEEMQNKIQALINEECTAIHPTVEWRFKNAAFKLLHQKENDPGSTMEEIFFEDLYPLYGLSDIRNSSIHRNEAIQADLIEHLTLVDRILASSHRKKPLPILDELRFLTNTHIDSLSKGLNSGDELTIIKFLQDEIASAFDMIRNFDPSVVQLIDDYNLNIDNETKLLYRKRKDYEESVSRINDVVGSYLDEAQLEAQEMYPHYFEKYKTDGVEHSIYIGQSLVQNKDYSPMYLKNLRIWQLLVLCGIARETDKLKPQLKVKLDTTHLILVQNNPLSIRFRYDEKKFDVDGTYNIRYEIMKKRIDKAIVKGSEERLTLPGKISVVYSQSSEANEYKRYFDYLRSKDFITGEVEELELEPLQGVQGLKALRIKVNLNTNNQTRSNIKVDVKEAVKNIREYVN
jgi:GAF domain-containing protein